MRKSLLLCGVGLMSAALAGCVREARIATPSGLVAASEQIELEMGNGERGRLRLGASEGRFTRQAIEESRDWGFETLRYGGGTFDVSGPEVGGGLAGTCGYDESERNLGSLAVADLRFAYRCRFARDGAPIEAGLILEEIPTRPGRLLSARTRTGEVHIDDMVVTIRAVHEMEGGGLPTGTPLGYAFDVDGRAIGAVDLNGSDKTIFAPRSGPERQAVLAASLALSILWDPME
jgi:hypothetical protein